MLPILSRKLVKISPLWADPSRKNRAEKQRLRPLFNPQNHPAKGRTPTFMSPESTFELLGTRSWCASSASFLSKSANLRDQECHPSWPKVPLQLPQGATLKSPKRHLFITILLSVVYELAQNSFIFDQQPFGSEFLKYERAFVKIIHCGCVAAHRVRICFGECLEKKWRFVKSFSPFLRLY